MVTPHSLVSSHLIPSPTLPPLTPSSSLPHSSLPLPHSLIPHSSIPHPSPLTPTHHSPTPHSTPLIPSLTLTNLDRFPSLSHHSLITSPTPLPNTPHPSLPHSLTHPHKLGQVPAWYFHHHIIQTWLKTSCCCLGNRVLEGGKGERESQLGCNIGEGVAGRLGGKGGAS